MHQEITTVGVDLAKNVFQVHGVSADGRVVVRRQFRRAEVLKFFSALPPCLVGMEACASAHHWARELIAIGHEVKLMPPAYVKAYVKRGKTDAADAEAITEAVTRPTMRFVAVKSAETQAVLMLHKTRDLLVRQRTMLINGISTLGSLPARSGPGARPGGAGAQGLCAGWRRLRAGRAGGVSAAAWQSPRLYAAPSGLRPMREPLQAEGQVRALLVREDHRASVVVGRAIRVRGGFTVRRGWSGMGTV
jgi:hypothetical protein